MQDTYGLAVPEFFTDADINQWKGTTVVVALTDGAPSVPVQEDVALLKQYGIAAQYIGFVNSAPDFAKLKNAAGLYVATGEPVTVNGTKRRSLSVEAAQGLMPYMTATVQDAVAAGVYAVGIGVPKVGIFDAHKPNGLLYAMKGKKSTTIKQPIAAGISG